MSESEQQEQPVVKEEQPASRAARPLRSLWDLRGDMDRLWQGFPALPRLGRLAEVPSWPALDVFEKDGSLVVKADLPGLTVQDIEVNLTDEGLTISGERHEEKEVKEKDYYRSERSYGRFMRQVPLPVGADRENVAATFKDGVLQVTLPLKEDAKQKKVEVRTE